MFRIEWDKDTGGVLLRSKVTKETLGISPRPVWFEELDLLGLDKLGYNYPRSEAPLMWAVNKQYFYHGELMFEAKGANIYDSPVIVFHHGKETAVLEPVDVGEMLRRNNDQMFLIENEAIEFIRDTYIAYAGVNQAYDSIKANQNVDYETLAQRIEKKTKQRMAVVKEDCDSFDVMPLDTANAEGKRVLLSTHIDRFISSFSGGKDSQVVLDLVTRAIPPSAFEVIYSDTGYELPSSLNLYEEVKRYYGERFPALKFSITRNHESVLNYWDKIGSPSDTHRWCCSIMKTAPLYRSLKTEGNKQARVLTFDGVRAEESNRRSAYNRVGKGKHVHTYNAHPIFEWNVAEIFLYIMSHNLPNNPDYRFGLTRVGCIICPFGSDWSDFIVGRLYAENREPFLNKLQSWVKCTGVKDVNTFIKTRRWHISALGDPSLKKTERVLISSSNKTTKITISTTTSDFFEWLKVIGPYSMGFKDEMFSGNLKVGKEIISFSGKRADGLYITFNTDDKRLVGDIVRIAYKSAYCVSCEVCEVQCPTGALHILPHLSIGSQCIHCLKCLSWHERGCIAADCVRKISNKIKMDTSLSIKGYKTFGLRDEWIDEFVRDPERFWDSTLLGSAMFDSFKAWSKDAGLLDSKNQITPFGKILASIYVENSSLFWEIIWINLSYSSFIVNRFATLIKPGTAFDKKYISDLICSRESVSSLTTLNNAVGALFDMFKNSPIGEEFEQAQVLNKIFTRRAYDNLSVEAVAYSLYLYGEKNNTTEFRVSDFYGDDGMAGIYVEFGISKNALLKKLRYLSSEADRVIVAELNMGLDHITLRKDLTATSALELLTR
ncbi:MAG: phosphoadenosine phosphosulfate reductase family protein [Clostridia bacterium]|nr:phosphoadenosine phosphosulfate reductase family protein [Clostridia bacterium]